MICYIDVIAFLKGASFVDLQHKDKAIGVKQTYGALMVLGIVIVAFNLRPGMTSVGPLIGIIRDDVGLENWSAGLLTSLPLLAFALISPIVPSMSQRFTSEMTMVIGLMVLMLGIVMRSLSFGVFLFGGTVLVGLGIAICNVLLPSVVKEKFPTKVGLMTSVYSTSMGVLAAIASGLSIPFARGLGMGWEFSLLVWTIPAFMGIVIWTVISKKTKARGQGEQTDKSANHNQIWRSSLAWQIALFMGLQSSLFYVTVSWLPEILHHSGLEIATAGWMLSYAQMIGMPASFFIPVIAGRMKSQRPIVLVMGGSALLGFSGLLIGKSFFVLALSSTFVGITIGGSFALALTFLAIRARSARDAGKLSGMAQSIGYLIAAAGPVLIGFLFDLTGNWTVPLIVLLGISVLVIIFGLGAGRDAFVFEE